MSFQAIGFLWAAVTAASVVVVLHLLARRRPHPMMLPTARFVPEAAVRAPAFHRRPSDLLLLALRVAALLLLGAALARPEITGPRRPVAALTIGDSVGSLSAAFAAALRASPALGADSVALVLAMSLTRDRWDPATVEWRSRWPGAVRLEHMNTQARGRADVVWPELPGGDALRAVVLGDLVAVGRWGAGPLPAGTPVAFFNDGTPAAVEVRAGGGCMRHVGIGRPADDAALRPAFRRIERRLRSAPCDGLLADPTPLDSAELQVLAGTGGPASAEDLPSARPRVRPSWLLFLLGVLALAAEQAVRRRAA